MIYQCYICFWIVVKDFWKDNKFNKMPLIIVDD